MKSFLNDIYQGFELDFYNFSDERIEQIKQKDVFDGKMLFLLEKIFLRMSESGGGQKVPMWSQKTLGDVLIVNKCFQFEILEKLKAHFKDIGLNSSQRLEECKLVLTAIEQMFIEKEILTHVDEDSNFGVFDVFL